MAKKDKEETTIARLADVSDLPTGLEGYDETREVRRFYAFNASLLDPRNPKRALPRDVFIDTLDNTVMEEPIPCIFISTVEVHKRSTYDEAQSKTVIHCRSYDKATGIDEEGNEHSCKACGLTIGRGGRPECAVVALVAGWDFRREVPFAVSFKRTSLGPWAKHVSRWHLNALRQAGQPTRHVPLWAVQLQLGLESKGNYAVPTFTVDPEQPYVPPTTMAELREIIKKYSKIEDEEVEKAGEQKEEDVSSLTNGDGGVPF